MNTMANSKYDSTMPNFFETTITTQMTLAATIETDPFSHKT